MFTGVPGVSNSGSMPIKGGDAKSGNGDQSFGATTTFGGINYGGAGVSPWLIGALALMALFVMKKG